MCTGPNATAGCNATAPVGSLDTTNVCTMVYEQSLKNNFKFVMLLGMLFIPIGILVYVKFERRRARQLAKYEASASAATVSSIERLLQCLFSSSADVVLPVYDLILCAGVFEAMVRSGFSIARNFDHRFVWDGGKWWFWVLWGFGLQGCRHFLGLVITLCLVQRSSGKAAFRRAFYWAGAVVLTAGALSGALVYALEDTAHHDDLTRALFLASDGITISMYLLVLAYMVRVRRARWKTFYLYVATEVVLSALYSLGTVSDYLPRQAQLLCGLTIADMAYIFVVPWVVLATLRDDSRYWRMLGRQVGASGAETGPEVFDGSINCVTRRSYRQLAEFLGMEIKLLDFARLEILHGLGSGGSASVFKANYGTQVMAIKALDFDELTVDVVRTFCKEAILSFRVSHANVVQFLGVCLQPPDMFLAFEYCARGSLRALLDDSSVQLTALAKVQLALDSAEGVAFLHSKMIIHRDLKSDNILVQEDPTTGALLAKIADFGLSRIVMPEPPRRSSDPDSRRATTSARTQSSSSDPVQSRPSAEQEQLPLPRVTSPSAGTSRSSSTISTRLGEGKGRHGARAPRRLAKAPPSSELTTLVGTLEYLPPEILGALRISTELHLRVDAKASTAIYGYGVDTYAFGVVLHEIMTRKYPYESLKTAQEVQRYVLAGLRMRIGPGIECPESYRRLMNRCWAPNPGQRPGFRSICKRLKSILFHDCSAYDSGDRKRKSSTETVWTTKPEADPGTSIVDEKEPRGRTDFHVSSPASNDSMLEPLLGRERHDATDRKGKAGRNRFTESVGDTVGLGQSGTLVLTVNVPSTGLEDSPKASWESN